MGKCTDGSRDEGGAVGHLRVEGLGGCHAAVAWRLDRNAAVAALIEWPPKIRTRTAAVDLFPGVPAGIGDEQSAVRSESNGEGIAEPELVHLGAVAIQRDTAGDERIVRQA